MTADDIVNAARECVGTPFRHQGRVLGVGLDCAGLVLMPFSAVGPMRLTSPGTGERRTRGCSNQASMRNRISNVSWILRLANRVTFS